MSAIAKHFVTFYSPGTFVAEASEKPIDSWDVDQAVEMSKGITERYNAHPYGFRFSTRSRGPEDLDSKQSATSPMYYLGGIVRTLEEIKAKNDPKDRILISNMEGNGYSRVISAASGWSWTQPLHDEDVVLDLTVAHSANTMPDGEGR